MQNYRLHTELPTLVQNAAAGHEAAYQSLYAADNSQYPFNMNTWYHPKTITPNNAANPGTPLHAQQLKVDI